jgi:monothiol glutaredoxin
MNETSDAKARIQALVDTNKVVLFMKGNKSFPQCGFSNAVVQILKQEGVEFETFNVLSDADVRQGIKDYASWPTIPQLYIGGKFVGGCDIVKEMHASGELDKELRAAGVKK